MFKRIAIGAVSLAMPLAMAGAPAFASHHGGHGYNRPDIDITDVDYKYGKFVVDVDYDCSPEYSGAEIKVKLKLNHSYYEGKKWVDCDEDDASVYLWGHDRVQRGYGYVDASITDRRGRTASDDATIKVKVGHR